MSTHIKRYLDFIKEEFVSSEFPVKYKKGEFEGMVKILVQRKRYLV